MARDFSFASERVDAREYDAFSRYEIGLDQLLTQMTLDHPRYVQALTYQDRLRFNIDEARRLGDTESSRRDRSEIIGELNRLALDVLRRSFNDLCDSSPPEEYLSARHTYHHVDTSGSKAPHIPPDYPRGFVERQEQLAELTEVILHEGKSLGIFGMGGLGKSALAQVIFHRTKDYFSQDGYSWYTASDKSPNTLISRIASDFGVPYDPNLEARKLKLRFILAERRALILLDDVTSTQVVKELFELAPSCIFIITSRIHILSGGRLHDVELDPLSEAEALTMFLNVYGQQELKSGEEECIRQICREFGYLPLAIEIVASRVRVSGIEVATVLQKLKPSKEILRRLHYGDLDVRSSFETSFEELDEMDRRLFASLSVFAGDDFSLEAIEHVSQIPDADTRLEDLVTLSLVKPRAGRFTLHPLLKSFAREKLIDMDTYRRQAKYFFTYARLHRHPLDGLDLDAQNILGCLPWCQQQMAEQECPSLVDFLVDLLDVSQLDAGRAIYLFGRLYKRHGDAEAAFVYYEKTLQVARSMGDQALEGACLRSLGDLYLRYNRDEGLGFHHIEKALEVLSSSEDTALKKERVFTLNLLIEYYLHRGNTDEVKKFAAQSLKVRDTIPREEQDPSEGLYYAAAVLIDLYRKEGAVQNAYDLLERERDNLGGVDLASSLGLVGQMMSQARRFSLAERLFNDAFEVYKTLNNYGGCAWIKKCMGEMCKFQGDAERAIAYHKEAWELRQRAGEKHETVAALIDLARIYCTTGHQSDGRNCWQEYVRAYKGLMGAAQDKGKVCVASAVSMFGEALIPLQAGSLTQEVLVEAEQLYEQAQNLEGTAYVKYLLGNYWLSRGRQENAKALYEQAVNLRKKVGKPTELLQALEHIAEFCSAEGYLDLAHSYWQGCLLIYEAQGNRDGAERITKRLAHS